MLSGTTAAKELASAANYYAYGLGGTTSRGALAGFVGGGLNDNAAKHLAGAARLTANTTNARTSGFTEASGFNVEDMFILGIAASRLIKVFSYKSFYSVQSVDDYMRLKAGGTPWPTAETRAQLEQEFMRGGAKQKQKLI